MPPRGAARATCSCARPPACSTFTIAVTLYATAGWLLAAPLLAPLGAIDFGVWEPDGVLDGLLLVPAARRC